MAKTDSLIFSEFLYNVFDHENKYINIKKKEKKKHIHSYLPRPLNSRKLIAGNAQNDRRIYIIFFTLTNGGGQFALYRA